MTTIEDYLSSCAFSLDRKRSDNFKETFLKKVVCWTGKIARVNNGSIDLIMTDKPTDKPTLKLRMTQQTLSRNMSHFQTGAEIRFSAILYCLRLLFCIYVFFI